MKFLIIMIACINVCFASEAFTTGPVIKNYGKKAEVTQTNPVDNNSVFKVAFDVADQSKEKQHNRHFESLARFMNMHVAAGVKQDNIKLALVVHGKAGYDLLTDEQHEKQFGYNNSSKALLTELMAHNVRVIICGQSAAYLGIKNEHLLDGVEIALSAMTAHALLQQQGYSVNPF